MIGNGQNENGNSFGGESKIPADLRKALGVLFSQSDKKTPFILESAWKSLTTDQLLQIKAQLEAYLTSLGDRRAAATEEAYESLITSIQNGEDMSDPSIQLNMILAHPESAIARVDKELGSNPAMAA